MAYEPIVTFYGHPWGNQIQSVESGHFAVFYPGNSDVAPADRNCLVLYNAAGIEVARQQGALGAFSLAIQSGEIVATVTKFGENGVPIARWRTGIHGTITPPTQPPTGTNNATLVAEIEGKMAEIQALLDQSEDKLAEMQALLDQIV